MMPPQFLKKAAGKKAFGRESAAHEAKPGDPNEDMAEEMGGKDMGKQMKAHHPNLKLAISLKIAKSGKK